MQKEGFVPEFVEIHDPQTFRVTTSYTEAQRKTFKNIHTFRNIERQRSASCLIHEIYAKSAILIFLYQPKTVLIHWTEPYISSLKEKRSGYQDRNGACFPRTRNREPLSLEGSVVLAHRLMLGVCIPDVHCNLYPHVDVVLELSHWPEGNANANDAGILRLRCPWFWIVVIMGPISSEN